MWCCVDNSIECVFNKRSCAGHYWTDQIISILNTTVWLHKFCFVFLSIEKFIFGNNALTFLVGMRNLNKTETVIWAFIEVKNHHLRFMIFSGLCCLWETALVSHILQIFLWESVHSAFFLIVLSISTLLSSWCHPQMTPKGSFSS